MSMQDSENSLQLCNVLIPKVNAIVEFFMAFTLGRNAVDFYPGNFLRSE